MDARKCLRKLLVTIKQILSKVRQILLWVVKNITAAICAGWNLMFELCGLLHYFITEAIKLVMRVHHLYYNYEKVKLTKKEWELILQINFVFYILSWSFIIYCFVTSSFIDVYFPSIRVVLDYIRYIVRDFIYIVLSSFIEAYETFVDILALIKTSVIKALNFLKTLN